jgi:acyl carrier protein
MTHEFLDLGRPLTAILHMVRFSYQHWEVGMTVDAVTKTIITVLKELQLASGRACGELTGNTKPIGDLIGFDSLSAIEATVAIEAALGKELNIDNLLVAEINGREQALTITGAAERIVKVLNAKAA